MIFIFKNSPDAIRESRCNIVQSCLLLFLLTLPCQAGRTAPVYLQAMLLNHKAVLGGNLLLQTFDAGIFKFDDRPADRADKVIMVLLFIAALVSGMTVAKMTRSRQSTLSEEFKGAMHRGVTDMRIFFANAPIKFFRRQVRSRRQKFIKDHFPLLGDLEAVLTEIFTKGIFVIQKQPLIEIGFQFNQ